MHMTYYIQLIHAQCTTIYSLLMHNALQSTAYSCTMHYYMQLTHAHDLLWPCHVLSTPTERCTTLPVYCRVTQWDTQLELHEYQQSFKVFIEGLVNTTWEHSL